MRLEGKVGDNGKIVIPNEIRKALGLKPGSTVVVKVENDRIVIRKKTRRNS